MLGGKGDHWVELTTLPSFYVECIEILGTSTSLHKFTYFTFIRNPLFFIKMLARKTEGEDERFFRTACTANISRKWDQITIQVLSFIAAPSTTALSHRKPASAGTSRDSCGAQDNNKINALYNEYFFVICWGSAVLYKHWICRSDGEIGNACKIWYH